MDVFNFRDQVVDEYADYIRSFVTIHDDRIRDKVVEELNTGLLWPEPLIQLNPAFQPGPLLAQLISEGALHPQTSKIFRRKPTPAEDYGPLRFHTHQVQAIDAARAGDNYVLTTGTGSGKSLAYIVPIVDHVLRQGSGKGIQAIIVYPMNALANSQIGELEKFLDHGFDGRRPVTFARYTGQENREERQAIIQDPPDILLTNFVMLELILTRVHEQALIRQAEGLRFLVLDELHTYRGRQGSDVSMLVRRVREACKASQLIHVGTSATLASEGTWREQQEAVASVASRLFGSEVRPERIIGETLKRSTAEFDFSEPETLRRLRDRIESGAASGDTGAFLQDPLAAWIESNVGVRTAPDSDSLIRQKPKPLRSSDEDRGQEPGLAETLAEQTGLDADLCERQLREALLKGHELRDQSDRPVFAFRLHQFLSKGDTVYASLEYEAKRQITLRQQRFVPDGSRERVYLPLAFCRECGQEYYVVRRQKEADDSTTLLPRELSDRFDDDDGEAGFLHISEANPWPTDPQEELERLPDAWLEEHNGELRVRDARKKRRPQPIRVSSGGRQGAGTTVAQWLGTPFMLCLRCGVSYAATQRSDFGKLASLGTEGRSSANSVLNLSAIRLLRSDSELESRARKVLSFSDNRQDASLQAGHFNDMVEIGLVRAALASAVRSAGASGLRHDEMPSKVFEALNLPLDQFAIDPGVTYLAKDETERAFRKVLEYMLYRDLQRGWRLTSPNLEQCGLLKIEYASLHELCRDEKAWMGAHDALVEATPEERERVCMILLDHLRRELAIRADVLTTEEQERIERLSSQHLKDPWRLDAEQRLERARIALPRSRSGRDRETFVYLSARGGFGYVLRRSDTFAAAGKLRLEDTDEMIRDLFEVLTKPGLLHRVLEPKEEEEVPGYQLNAAGLVWRPGDGSEAFHDPIRMPSAPESGPRTNPYFVRYYQLPSEELAGLEAKEHTAQIAPEAREHRESRFRRAHLPVMFCSPTMELGVDIAELNVVGMRNVPPTPANYAQRSGRAGRGGQPAFVFTYCAAGSPHDQYFFRDPERMVQGQVTPPRLDLSNEDLLTAHLYAIWLSTSGLDLKSSMRDLLDLHGENPSLELLPEVQEKLREPSYRRKALHRALDAMGEAVSQVVEEGTDAEGWIRTHLEGVERAFEKACERWRGLYRAALDQQKQQNEIARDAGRDHRDRNKAKRLRAEAESQLQLLLENQEHRYSDFYTYRYFASEGFLPGYNFPRLPLAAYLPGRRRGQGTDEFLSRPRFLAISEFGPRANIYHEGSRYIINRVILPVESDQDAVTSRACRCEECGYMHGLGAGPAPDLCEHCGSTLPHPLENLFRMQNVSTRRRDRITSDEEERQRLGYELKTGVRFADRGGRRSMESAKLVDDEGMPMAVLTYGAAAELWRMNLGWQRRQNQEETGFRLDLERGYWARNKRANDDDPAEDLSARIARVIPFVTDRKNCLVLNAPGVRAAGLEAMASVQAALKHAIQAEFELEDAELATEPLPSFDDRRLMLFYENTEGGAGVLRRLVQDRDAFRAVVRRALELTHFDPDTGADRGRAEGAREDCEAACYDCLLSYYNQRDHRFLDRKLLPDLLSAWLDGALETAPTERPRHEHVEALRALTQSSLERKWLDFVADHGLTLPTHGQFLIEGVGASADFFYGGHSLAVFVDGPSHDKPAAREADAETDTQLENAGYFVLRFPHDQDWQDIFSAHPGVFGPLKTSEPSTDADQRVRLDLDYWADEWHELITRAADEPGWEIEPGEDLAVNGRIVGQSLGAIRVGERTAVLIEEQDDRTDVRSAIEQAGGHPVVLAGKPTEDLEAIRDALETR